MSISNSFLLLVILVIFSCAILPAAKAMDVINSNGNEKDAVNSTEKGENECPKGQSSCWAEYKGKWMTQLINENVNRKINGQNAIYNGTDGTCGVCFCFFGNIKYF
jgi:hypothetical protein